jgi:23S rRNA pseudouridine1911/1915/1917 synthase
MVRNAEVLVNGKPAQPSTPLFRDDTITLRTLPAEAKPLEYAPPEVTTIYEDADILVLDKPAGLSVHPGAGKSGVTLSDILFERYPGLAGVGEAGRPGIVHRLDKDTSGLMVVALTQEAYSRLVQMFKEHRVKKKYLVLVVGRVEPSQGAIEAPLGRHPARRQLMAVVEGGRPARTTYRVIRNYPAASLVEAGLETGRTHQIRVHFAAIGHPVAGDAVYGEVYAGLKRQFLHAARLEFAHPLNGKPLTFTSLLPADLAAFLDTLGKETAPQEDPGPD